MIRNRLKSQAFNDGIVQIYEVTNTASPPSRPVEVLGDRKESLRYKERTVGNARYYAAMHENVKIEKLLRVPYREGISTQDVAVPNDGKQYKIVQIQRPEDVMPPVMDLALERLVPEYDIG